MKCAEWGFPLTLMDIRNLVQEYLNRGGIVEKRFNQNMPGRDWALAFLRRNPVLSQRLCTNIKRVRAGVDRETLTEYFGHLRESLRGVPAGAPRLSERGGARDPPPSSGGPTPLMDPPP